MQTPITDMHKSAPPPGQPITNLDLESSVRHIAFLGTTCIPLLSRCPAGNPSEAKPSALKALLTPFSDSAANAKLLALCGAGALSSVATLIHDTYLPIYLSEVLGLSNTKVR